MSLRSIELPPGTPVLAARGLTKSYGGARARRVLAGVDLILDTNDFVAIMGESGVGKSTLLNLLAGLDTPDSGSVEIGGIRLADLNDDARTLLRRDYMGFVFQAFHVLPHLTVAQNVALPLALTGRTTADLSRRVDEMLDAVGIASAAAAYPRELSGGELQRTAIARALVHRPHLLLADEPTGNLDPVTAGHILELLREQVKRECGACILVTHSALAAATADRVLVLGADGLRRQE